MFDSSECLSLKGLPDYFSISTFQIIYQIISLIFVLKFHWNDVLFAKAHRHSNNQIYKSKLSFIGLKEKCIV
jgi:hypothetical protein